MKKFYCVISHTHWDREWYKSFESFRMQLCSLINNLLKVIGEYPDYIFHLDAQTVVLEDYLEIYPENRGLLEKYIKNGNIIVGPWYLQNDYYLTSGESTIRNLLVGTRLAEQFGGCGKAGYAPDQFGNISQLPQILNNFGIDNFIFGRGFNPYDINEKGEKYLKPIPAEFMWRGSDGSELLAVHLRYWYNNAQRFSADINKAEQLVHNIENGFEGVTASPYLLLMNGVDHLEAQEDLLPILEELNKREINGEIKQTLMSDYIDSVRSYAKENDKVFETYSGELRHGGDGSLLQGTLSSRHYLKVANVRAQNLLENRVEPLYSMLFVSGFDKAYPKNYMRYLWKLLMQNHPHDSICGCSRDEVHRHMEDRYERINEVTEVLIKEGLELAAYHNGSAVSDKSAYSLIFANTTGRAYQGLAKATLKFPESEDINNFAITDTIGREVEFAVTAHKKEKLDIFSPINLPGNKIVDVYDIYMPIKNIEPMSFACYKITRIDGAITVAEENVTKTAVLENEYLRVDIKSSGRVDILCKQSDRLLEDCLYLEDTADIGNAYVFGSAKDKPITSRHFNPTVEMIENNNYRNACSISYNMELPSYYDFDKEERSQKTENTTCELILSLEQGMRYVGIDYKIDNKSCDHRLRLFVKTDVITDNFIADIPFDIITRRDDDINPMMVDISHPNTSFAALESETCAAAVFTEGAHECTKSGADTLGFTLVRATGFIDRNGGSQWECIGNQCLRVIEGRMAIYPYASYEGADLMACSTAFRNPPLSCCVPCDSRKLTGGRPAVQDSAISELFYRDDPYAKVELNDGSLLSCDNSAVVITAFKQSEEGDGIIVRFFNSSASGFAVNVSINGDIYASDMSEKIGDFMGRNTVSVSMRGKQIVTLYIKT